MKMVKDYPGFATTLAVVAVLAHWSLAKWAAAPVLPDAFLNHGEVWQFYLGAASVVAILAGFSGVLIVFGLTPNNSALERLRARGGARLRANWGSLVTSPLMAAVLFLTAAGLALAGRTGIAGWTFEVAAALGILSALRLAWLFKRLVGIDIDKPEPSKRSSLELVKDARRSGVGD